MGSCSLPATKHARASAFLPSSNNAMPLLRCAFGFLGANATAFSASANASVGRESFRSVAERWIHDDALSGAFSTTRVYSSNDLSKSSSTKASIASAASAASGSDPIDAVSPRNDANAQGRSRKVAFSSRLSFACKIFFVNRCPSSLGPGQHGLALGQAVCGAPWWRRRVCWGGAGETGSMSSRGARRGSAPHDAAPSKADVSVGSPECGGNNACRVLLTHRGVSLEERRFDDETTEYTVRRGTRDAIARSAFPAWCALAACFAVAHALAAVADGTSSGGTAPSPEKAGSGFRSPPLAFAAAASFAACLAVRALGGAVVSESALLMRHVGVRLSHETVLRFGGDRKQRGVRFIDVDRLRSAAVLEAVRAKDVRSYLCFRVFPASALPEETTTAGNVARDDRGPRETTGEGDDEKKKRRDGEGRREGRRVVLVFSKIRPGLPVAREAYRRAHAAMFAAREETVLFREKNDTETESERNLRSEAEAFADSLRCLPGPARGLGWWRGAEGTGGDGDVETTGKSGGSRRESILMVSDFFLPNLGGVELHMYSLAQRLLKRGHRVTVLTHAYGDRCGVRYMTNGLKVYYAFRVPVYNGSTLPDIFGNFKLLRAILLREKITVVHAHQAFSVMGHEAVFHARTMGQGVFTDHSLFGFSDTSAIHMNKLRCSRSATATTLRVSHTAKENTVLRSGAPPRRVSVVPNAVDAARFTPDSSMRLENGRVVVLKRAPGVPPACTCWPA